MGICNNPSAIVNVRNIFTPQFIKDGLSLKIKNNTNSFVLHSQTVLVKLCPCGRYRQLNSVLYSNNHILKSIKIIVNGLVFFLDF